MSQRAKSSDGEPRRSRSRIEPMTPGISTGARLRARIAAATITVGLVGLGWRAWALQIDDNPHYRELATRQHALTVDIPAPRGEILDVQGRPLAVSADAESIWANPREIRDVAATADRLATIIGDAAKVDAAALEAKLAGDRRFVWIARHVKPELATAVRAAKLHGIEVAREPRRWYPARAIAGPVVGRSDIDGKGLDGIELALDTTLTGTRGAGIAVRDARGRRAFADGMEQPAQGASVKLTLDRSLQTIAEDALAEAVVAHSASSGTVVVLDVATSRVLAMASYPTSDPNGGGPVARNRPVTDVYEIGSVMKLFSVAAALDAGVVSPDTEFDIQLGHMQLGRDAIRDTYHDKYLTVSGIIKRSSNVGTVKIAQRLGKDRLREALVRFGFGAKTNIELPGEQGGRLRAAKRWREIEFATISFGYGLTVTPIQVAAALAAIGGDGTYRPPRVIDSIIDADGIVTRPDAPPATRAITPKTARQLRAMLATVFEGGKVAGTAANIVVPGFLCGGKTGTARKWDAEQKQYSTERYLSSFAGLAPIQNPRLAIVVVVDEPSGGDYYGGKVAGPVFARVASESLRYLGVPGLTLACPPPPPGPVTVNPFAIVPPRTCTINTPRPAKPAVVGLAHRPAAPPEPAVVIQVEPGGIPDFTGMGLRRALDTARTAALAIEVAGSGRVVAQDPAPGTRSDRVVLRFSDGDAPSSSSP